MLKEKKNRDKQNPLNNSKLQANIIGSAEPYVLLTVTEETGSDTDDDIDLAPLIMIVIIFLTQTWTMMNRGQWDNHHKRVDQLKKSWGYLGP